jgi:hypothetical protein
VLLPKEADPVEHLTGSTASFLETQLQIRVFALELFDPLGTGARGGRRCLEGLHSRLGVQCAPAEGGELVTEVTNKLVEVRERRFQLSLFVV